MSARTSWRGSTSSRPSTGSACHSGRVELSPVLTAMGIRPEIGMGAIRFSLGRYTAIEEIDAVGDRLTDVLAAGSRVNAQPPGLVEGTDRRSLLTVLRAPTERRR